ncbi:MAG: FG-GAP-like repeat-containing protein [Pirellulaceae bacterium]
MDGDGTQDMIASSIVKGITSETNQDAKRTWKHWAVDSGVYFLKGRQADGELRFADPVLIGKAPKGVGIEGLAVGDLDDDGKLELVASIFYDTDEETGLAGNNHEIRVFDIQR